MVFPDLTISLVDFKVVSFEGRRAELMESLIRQHGGECFDAPSEMAVVGRPRSCAEATVKDIGLVGPEDRWQVVVGGAAGKGVRKADLLIAVETTEMALGIRGGLLSVLSRETPAAWNALTTLWSA